MDYSLAYQRMSIEHLIAMAGDREGGTVIDAAKQACIVLAWLEKRQELVKAVANLDRQRPDLVDLFRAFPGAEIADVRPMFPSYANGSGVHDDDGA